MNTLPPDDTTPERDAWEDWIDQLDVGDLVQVEGTVGAVLSVDDNGALVRFPGRADPSLCAWETLMVPTLIAESYFKAALDGLLDEFGSLEDADDVPTESVAVAYRWGHDRGAAALADLRRQLDDALLALAMTRGEGWPAGWDRRPAHRCWVLEVGDSQWTIRETIFGHVSNYLLTGPSIWSRGPDGPIRTPSHESTHPDLLAALRTYEAVVKS